MLSPRGQNDLETKILVLAFRPRNHGVGLGLLALKHLASVLLSYSALAQHHPQNRGRVVLQSGRAKYHQR